MADTARVLVTNRDARPLSEEEGRAMLLRAGLCVSCADRAPLPGQTLCGPCARGDPFTEESEP